MKVAKGDTAWMVVDGAVVSGVVTHASTYSANVRVGSELYRGKRADDVYATQSSAETALAYSEVSIASEIEASMLRRFNIETENVKDRRRSLARAEEDAKRAGENLARAQSAHTAKLNAFAARQFGDGVTVEPVDPGSDGELVCLHHTGLIPVERGAFGRLYRVVRPNQSQEAAP